MISSTMSLPRTPKFLLRAVSLCLSLTALAAFASAAEAIWQWSAPVGEGRAFLWIPEDCRRVRAVVVGQHNMIEQGILEHATMRRTLAALGVAEVFIVPRFDPVFRFDLGAGERFQEVMRSLASESGYDELASAPVIPIGHSACASYPWNFAAWNPGRTLAVLSIKGDAPQTDLTGSGRPNPDWGPRNIDGVPGLMVMSEAEWWDARLAPAIRFRTAHPAAPIAVLADVGHGHFDATDVLVEWLATFIRKAAEARLPVDGSTRLRPVDPTQGWLVDRWRGDEPLRASAASFADYRGDRAEAFWCFDEEMARATEALYATSRGKKKQQVDFVQAGALAPISTTHTGVELTFPAESEGLTFRLSGDFITPLPPRPPIAAKDKPPPPTKTMPTPASPGMHAVGVVSISPITGPVEQIAPNTFRVAFSRIFPPTEKHGQDIWLLASHPGDSEYKGGVQQALLRLPRFTEGTPQTITFPAIADQPLGTPTVALTAVSDAGAPVGYYVREGPAYVREGVLHLTPLPPRAKLPVKVTVVAWQLGRATEPKLQAAPPVERTFLLSAP